MYKLRIVFILTHIFSLIANIQSSSVHAEIIDLNTRRAEEILRISQIGNEIARQFGAITIAPEIIMPSQMLDKQYGSGQHKIMEYTPKSSLRYDLTVLLAKAMQQPPCLEKKVTVTASGPVFRQEIPDHSHFREFHQFEFDIFNPDSLADDATILEFAATTLEKLKIENYIIRINDRRIISRIATLLGMDRTKCQNMLDVFDKSQNEQRPIKDFITDLQDIQITTPNLKELFLLLCWSNVLRKNPIGAINIFLRYYEENEEVSASLISLRTIIDLLDPKFQRHVVLDPMLARGANYYDASIFEIMVPGTDIGAIFGGGRFRITDPTTGALSVGVGGAFGIERLYLALQPQLFPPQASIAIVGENLALILELARKLRERKFSVGIFKSTDKIPEYDYLIIFECKQISSDAHAPFSFNVIGKCLNIHSSHMLTRALESIEGFLVASLP